MDTTQINWLLGHGFSVQQLKDSGRYMMVRGETVILESVSLTGVNWTIKTPDTTLRMPLRACVELAASK